MICGTIPLPAGKNPRTGSSPHFTRAAKLDRRRYELVGTGDQLDAGPQTQVRVTVFHIHIVAHPPVPQERTMTTVASKLVLAAAGLVASVTAFADTPAFDVPSVPVRYDDLNLSTTAGVNALYHRI